MIDLYALIPVINPQFFNPTAEFVMPTGATTNESNTSTDSRNENKKLLKVV